MSPRHCTTPRRFRGVFYARMSTNEQDGSIAQQEQWAEAAGAREGIDLVGRFVDEAKRGHDTRRRTQFNAMLQFCRGEAAAGRPVDVIVCWHHNRFSRADSQETSWFIWEYRQLGVELMFTAERWIDFTRREDRMVFGITQEASNNKFSEDLAHATTRGIVSAVLDGQPAGGPRPYGYVVRYALVERNGKVRRRPECLIPDPERVPILQWIFAQYATGEVSVCQIVDDLNRRRVPPPSSGRRRRQAQFWNTKTIGIILRNEVYLGELLWNRRHQGKFFGVVNCEATARPGQRDHGTNPPEDVIRRSQRHEALVDRETFDACQRHLARRRRLSTPTARTAGAWVPVFTGMLRCGLCGGPMVGRNFPVRRKGQTGSIPSYVCNSYFAHGKTACTFNTVEEAPLLAALLRKLRERFTPVFLDQCRKAFRAEARADRTADQTRLLGEQIADLDTRISRATRRLLDEDDDRLISAYRAEVRSAQDERDRLAGQLAAAERALAGRVDPEAEVDACAALLARLEEALPRARPEEIRAVLWDVVERIELYFKTEGYGRRDRRERLVKGLVYLREDCPLAACLGSTGTSDSQARTIVLTSDDLYPAA